MNPPNNHNVRRHGVLMNRLLHFFQSNVQLAERANPPVRFMPQLIRHFTRDKEASALRSAIFDGKPHDEPVIFLGLELTWIGAYGILILDAAPGEKLEGGRVIIDLSDEAMDRQAARQQPPAQHELPALAAAA